MIPFRSDRVNLIYLRFQNLLPGLLMLAVVMSCYVYYSGVFQCVCSYE